MRTYMTAMLLAGILTLPALGDVKVVRTVETEGFDGFGGSKKDSVTWIAGDRRREELKGQGKPSMLEKMSGAGRPVITRLDKKVRWTLNVPKKRYEESPLVLPVEESAESPADKEDRSASDEKPTTRITKAEFGVKPLGKKMTIGSYPCDGYEMRAVLQTEDLETRSRSEMKMVTQLWTTPESGPVAQLKKDEEAYAKAYSQAVGLTEADQASLQTLGLAMIAGLAGAGEKDLAQALAKAPSEMKKIKGYPIRTRVEWYGSNDGEAGREETEESVEIPADAADMLGGLAAGWAKKKMEPKKRPAATPEGRLMFAMTTDVQSVSAAPIPAETFDIPAGFKKAR